MVADHVFERTVQDRSPKLLNRGAAPARRREPTPRAVLEIGSSSIVRKPICALPTTQGAAAISGSAAGVLTCTTWSRHPASRARKIARWIASYSSNSSCTAAWSRAVTRPSGWRARAGAERAPRTRSAPLAAAQGGRLPHRVKQMPSVTVRITGDVDHERLERASTEIAHPSISPTLPGTQPAQSA